jgi:hypothetical protein
LPESEGDGENDYKSSGEGRDPREKCPAEAIVEQLSQLFSEPQGIVLSDGFQVLPVFIGFLNN